MNSQVGGLLEGMFTDFPDGDDHPEGLGAMVEDPVDDLIVAADHDRHVGCKTNTPC